jgi:hypothetical protein
VPVLGADGEKAELLPCPPRKKGADRVHWSAWAPTGEEVKRLRRRVYDPDNIGKRDWPFADLEFNTKIDTSSPSSTFKHLFPLDAFAPSVMRHTNEKQEEMYEVSRIFYICYITFCYICNSFYYLLQKWQDGPKFIYGPGRECLRSGL